MAQLADRSTKVRGCRRKETHAGHQTGAAGHHARDATGEPAHRNESGGVRHPDAGPHSWNEISHALTPVIDEIVTEGTLRKWAAAYGIPDRGPRIKITPREFAAGLKAAGIALD
jgi:hypothetical protein